MQLPVFIKEPIVGIVGDTCYTSLVENLNIQDFDCIKYSISKCLGLAIVLGGSIVKVPQILNIVKNKSAQGLSLTSYLLDTLSCFINLSYNLRQGNPFSTFGEILFIAIQNVIITSLIINFTGLSKAKLVAFIAVYAGLFYCLNSADIVPQVAMSSLFAATIPISLTARIPQIYTNFKNKSTGQLAVFTVVNYFVGSAARVFTTMTELDDPIMLYGGLLATTLNGILVLQVIMYWNNKIQKQKKVD